MILIQNDAAGERRGWTFWACYAVTAVSALVSLGFAVSAVAGPSATPGGTDPYALYALSRSAALALAVLSVPVWKSSLPLLALGLTMAVVQGIDAGIGVSIHDTSKTVGPAVLCVLSAVTVALLASGTHRRQVRPG